MSQYRDQEAACLWHELKYVYPEFASPDERKEEEKKRDAGQAMIDLFGPEDRTEEPTCQSKD